ncbi:hypothetical protein KEM60_00684 [Austwickia sp. TVS 96-490-7B]|nr:hypothetical protein [Austwickia sp. TVS 96-490-7B]
MDHGVSVDCRGSTMRRRETPSTKGSAYTGERRRGIVGVPRRRICVSRAELWRCARGEGMLGWGP